MSVNSVETHVCEKSSVVDRVVEAARQGAHLSHEAVMVRRAAADAIEDGVHAAKRAVRRGVEKLEDIKDESIHHVKRQPVQTVAMAAGVGLAFGLAAGWVAGRVCLRRPGRGTR